MANPMEQVLYEVKKTIVGQDVLLERLLVALLAHGHILVEGVPGLAKTLAVKSLAGAVGGQFHRVQFTPDLVPSPVVEPVARLRCPRNRPRPDTAAGAAVSMVTACRTWRTSAPVPVGGHPGRCCASLSGTCCAATG